MRVYSLGPRWNICDFNSLGLCGDILKLFLRFYKHFVDKKRNIGCRVRIIPKTKYWGRYNTAENEATWIIETGKDMLDIVCGKHFHDANILKHVNCKN